MKLALDFSFQSSNVSLKYGEAPVLIGSCFADEIGCKIKQAGFNTYVNPFGTLFHPTAIANVLNSAMDDSNNVLVHQRDDVYFSWEASSKLFAYSKHALVEKVLEERRFLKQQLSSSKLLIITFGTSWGYRNKELDIIVGNCHKVPQVHFTKELSSIEEMQITWRDTLNRLNDFNPDLNVILTVSPVRHIKDGLIDNNRSKSRLIELVHALTNDTTVYFPAYEIVIDQLRDYRFYSTDLVHPSKEAVQIVWEQFMAFAMDVKSIEIMKERELILNGLNHRSLHPESKAEKARLRKVEQALSLFKQRYPQINWK